MPIDFYMHPVSGPCRAVMMIAERIGIELNKKYIDVLSGEQFQPEFMKVNPQHCVPTIVDNGFILWESRAIMAYLMNQYAPDSSLYPKEPEQRATVDRLLYFDIGTFHNAHAQVLLPMFLKGEPLDLEKLEEYKKTLNLLEQILAKTIFVAGNNVTIADFAILATITAMEAIDFNFADFPKIFAWKKRMRDEVPSYGEINDAPTKKFKELLSPIKKT